MLACEFTILILFVSIAGIHSARYAGANENPLCHVEHKVDTYCASYCYNVSKPKDAEISALKAQLAELRIKLSALKEPNSHCQIQVQISEDLIPYDYQLRDTVNNSTQELLPAEVTSLNSTQKDIEDELADCKVGLHKKSLEAFFLKLSRRRYIRLLEEERSERKNKTSDINRYPQKNISTIAKGAQAEEEHVYTSSCSDVKNSAIIRELKIDDIAPFRVVCDGVTAGPGWMVIQQRVDGIIKFAQNWATYRTGFGDLEGSYFLGLEKLYRITKSQPHELYIHLEDFLGNSRHAHYDYFSVGSEAEGYPLKDLGNYTGQAGDAGDALRYNNNMKFSTHDRDNDRSALSNCAKDYHSGWWHNACTRSNLNGLYFYGNGQTLSGIWWSTWRDKQSLKSVKMMIRPKS